MPDVARIGDPFADGDTIQAGSGDVFINNIPCARLVDATTGHAPPGHPFYPPSMISTGSGKVFVNNLPIARVDDSKSVHVDPGHNAPHPKDSTISGGSPDVTAG